MLIPWALCFLLPYYTNKVFYLKASQTEDSEVQLLKIGYTVVSCFYIICFLAHSFASQQSPSDEQLEPDSDDDAAANYSDEENEGEMIGQESWNEATFLRTLFLKQNPLKNT